MMHTSLFSKKNIPRKYNILQALSKLSLLTRKLKGKHLLYNFCINHMNVDTKRGGRVTLSFISSHKFNFRGGKSGSDPGQFHYAMMN
jgi:hypothetical protein